MSSMLECEMVYLYNNDYLYILGLLKTSIYIYDIKGFNPNSQIYPWDSYLFHRITVVKLITEFFGSSSCYHLVS